MRLVESVVQCFSFTCRACRNKVTSHTIEGLGCHFRMHATYTTDGICARCAVGQVPGEGDRAVQPKRMGRGSAQVSQGWPLYLDRAFRPIVDRHNLGLLGVVAEPKVVNGNAKVFGQWPAAVPL